MGYLYSLKIHVGCVEVAVVVVVAVAVTVAVVEGWEDEEVQIIFWNVKMCQMVDPSWHLNTQIYIHIYI